jgi:peptidoglycan hydrolase CwlO-like protein
MLLTRIPTDKGGTPLQVNEATKGLIRASYASGNALKNAIGAASSVEEELEELRELNKVLDVKAGKLEQLVRLKDAKIAALTARLQSAGLLIASSTD